MNFPGLDSPNARLVVGVLATMSRVIVAALAIALPAQAATFVVTSTADSGAGSLRAAITSANTTAGADTITFNLPACPCVITLASTLTVSEALTITGPGLNNLVIDGNNLVRVFTATAGPLTITDLTVRNGKAGAANGGAINATADLALTNVVVQGSTAASGGGVYAGGKVTVTDSVLKSNAATTGAGGAIYAVVDLSFTRVTINANTAATYGGGALVSGKTTVVDSVFEGNTAIANDGGGLYASGQLSISGSAFYSNKTSTSKGYGGGAGVIGFGPTTITATIFAGNSSADWGGGVYLADFTAPAPVPPAAYAPTTFLTDVEFTNNDALSGGGGGAFIWYASVITRVAFNDNFASFHGGGLYAGYANTLLPVVVTSGSFLRNSGAGGGGLYSDATIGIDGTLFDANTSRSGNGGAAWTPVDATVANATISRNVVLAGGNSGGIDTGGNLVISNSTVTGNRTFTGSGGGTGAGGNATVTNCHYVNNTAAGDGGGLLAYGTATVVGGNFSGNTAGNLGGGIATNNSSVTSALIENNHATNNWGGGLFTGAAPSVADTTFTQNTAKFAGGALAVSGGNAQITGGIFQGNQASSGGFGGAIYANGSSTTISGAQFLSNVTDGPGGAIATAGTGTLDISLSLFRQNQAAAEGGAIYAGNNLGLTRSRLIANQGSTGGGVFQNAGGGMIANSLFARNHATGLLGEAATLKPGGSTTLMHVTFGNGTVQAGGSAIYANGAGTVQILNSIVTSHLQGIVCASGTVAADYNLFNNNLVLVQGACITNSHAFAGNPAFVDVANDNYHIGAGSSAIDVAPSAGVSIDIDGDSRPIGSGYDVGYDERNGTAQTITFGPLANKYIDDPPFGVSGSASSGLAVVFSSLTASVCTVSGTAVTIVAAGTCTIAADQPGGATYDAAPRVSQSFQVSASLNPARDDDNDGIPNGVELVEGTNPLVKDNDVFGNARLFTMQQYRDFLSREGDASGITGWTNLITAGSYSRPQVINAFFNSQEFNGFVAPVVRLYFATFLRVPDYAGLIGNAALVRNGTVSLTQLADFFAASPEFVSLYGSLNNTQFVTLLYNNVLGRAPDTAGLNGWVSLLNGGTSRGQVLLGFSESPEYQAAKFNEAYVTMMYVGMLRRSPEPGGYNGWLAYLNTPGNTPLNMINGFFLSTEYHNRFLP